MLSHPIPNFNAKLTIKIGLQAQQNSSLGTLQAFRCKQFAHAEVEMASLGEAF